MERYPFLKRNVMVYNDKKSSPILINPYRRSPQKLSMLSRSDFLLFKQLTGHSKTKDICSRLSINKKAILNTLMKWSDKEWDMLEFLDVPIEEAKVKKAQEARYRNIAFQLYEELNSVQLARHDNNSVKRYHQKNIVNPLEQFEQVETTVSHVYREPHIILGRRNYGASFAHVLIQKGVIREGMSVLEIGGGVGVFARSFLDEIAKTLPKVYRNIEYALLDISPILLESQRNMLRVHNNMTRFIQGDIEKPHLGNERFDLIISNEMIADLTTVKLRKSDMEHSGPFSENKKRASFLINKFNLDISTAPKEFLFNLGAVEFVCHTKKILKPGGKAYIVEYGSEWSYPKAVSLEGHTEYSIHFGFLMEVAKRLNLNPRITALVAFLPFDKKIKVVNAISWFHINCYLLPFLNHEGMDRGVYTVDMMKEKIGEVFDRLSFVGVSNIGSGEVFLDPLNFYVLSLDSKKQNKNANSRIQ